MKKSPGLAAASSAITISRQTPVRRVRTELAKAVRRRTGTNPFQAKQLEEFVAGYMPTITASTNIENYIKVEYEI